MKHKIILCALTIVTVDIAAGSKPTAQEKAVAQRTTAADQKAKIKNQKSQAIEQVTFAEVKAQQHRKMNLIIGLLGAQKDLANIAAVVKKDLEFTGQFSVSLEPTGELTSKKQVSKWFKEGYPLAIYLQPTADGYEWHLYDTSDAHMIEGKKMKRSNMYDRSWAHALADELWPALTGAPGFFSTKIVYGKEMCGGR